MQHWPKEAIESIKKHFPKGDIDAIIRETGRSRTAIKIKANRMGIFLSPKIEIWYERIPIEKRIYLSGHFDGEGCARFEKKTARLSRTPVVSVQLCNIKTLELYQTCFNGKITTVKNKKGKPIYRWTCRKYEDVFNFILAVLPYSIEKKEQLSLLKDFIQLRQEERKTIALSSSFRKTADNLHEKCTALKKL
jgi:hypothetical protein